MQVKKPTKKYAKRVRRVKIFLILLIIFFLSISVFLFYQILSFKKISFVSPVSKIGFSKNTNFEDLLKKENIEYQNLKAEGDTYTFTVEDSGMVIISSRKDAGEQISSLQLILKRLKIEGKRFKSLDFRYDKPVIKL